MNVSHQAVVRTAPRGRRSTATLLKISVGRVCVSHQKAVLGWDEEGAGLAFLIQLLEKGWAVESAKRGARFLLSLYKNRDCFFIYSSFLAGKEAKEAGGTYDGSPLTPFQRPTGALPLSVDPAQ
ncbi:MAG: hypothetical protein ACLUR9_07860 [Christensenellales bacterium]